MVFVEMSHNLVTEQTKVDPLLAASTFFTTQHATVKRSRSFEVIDGECNMKRRNLIEEQRLLTPVKCY